MRFMHTSDWHLGRQFHNVSLLEDQAHILAQMIALARDEQLDAILIAGDIYDRSVPPAAAVALLDHFLQQVCGELGIPVLLIAGNHDSAERLGFAAQQARLGGLHVLGTEADPWQPFVFKQHGQQVHVYGLPYLDPASVRARFEAEVHDHDAAMAVQISALTEQLKPGVQNIVMAHCFVAGGEGCESERPLSIGGAEQVSADHFRGFDYAALGHLHGRQQRGAESIRYSGSPLKYSFSEQHQKKSVTLVELGDDGQLQIEQRELQPRRDMRVLEGPLEQLLQAGQQDPNAEDYLLVRVTDTHAILDIMGKLRAVYPNVLHLERPYLSAASSQRSKRERLAQGELKLFEDFFTEMTGAALSAPQRQQVVDLLGELHRSEEHS